MSPASRSKVSAGMPDEGPDRVAELEARLARLEADPSLKERGHRLVDTVMPPEASRHFFNAGREHLLGMRSIVDFWLRRLDAMEARAASKDPGRQTIDID
jgi:BMFP domain-containing protein YqiC